MRKLKAIMQPGCEALVYRVASFDLFPVEWTPDLRFLVLVGTMEERHIVEDMVGAGVGNVFWVESESLQSGNIVVPDPERQELSVLLRESDAHHALLMTNRCNSYCLMCSQPPTRHDDSWLVDEAIEAIMHMRSSPPVIGLSGGEPLLLGAGLRRVLDALEEHHPATTVEVLSNGRLLADANVVSEVLLGLRTRVRWLVPLYGHADFVHDFVVQTPGAFDETLAGLLALQQHNQEVQLRTVLVEPVLQILPELVEFIGRNLPFVSEVALMGCEPIGFALANRALCEMNLSDWAPTLSQSARILQRHSVPYLFMNAPLCSLPQHLWPKAHRSISDWKNVYALECDDCAVKADCCGLFAWHERGWTPAPLKALQVKERIE